MNDGMMERVLASVFPFQRATLCFPLYQVGSQSVSRGLYSFSVRGLRVSS